MLVYPCLALQDAASLSVELTASNGLRKNSGVAYNKAYNSQKELFATILKKHTPFDNPAFEALGFSQSQLDQWYVTNQHSLTAFTEDSKDPLPLTSHSRSRIAQKYTQAKTQVANALADAAATPVHYGVRQEYRITLELFQALDLTNETIRHPLWMPAGPPEPSESDDHAAVAPPPNPTVHQPYWVLPTTEVTAFISSSLN